MYIDCLYTSGEIYKYNKVLHLKDQEDVVTPDGTKIPINCFESSKKESCKEYFGSTSENEPFKVLNQINYILTGLVFFSNWF